MIHTLVIIFDANVLAPRQIQIPLLIEGKFVTAY